MLLVALEPHSPPRIPIHKLDSGWSNASIYMEDLKCRSRRRLLAIGGTSIIPVITGCNSLIKNRPAVALSDVAIRNLDDTEHTVRVRIRRSGEIVVDKEVTVEPMWGSDGNVNDDSFKVVSDQFPSTPAEYQLTVDGPSDQSTTGYLSPSSGSQCIAVEIQISEEGIPSVLVSGSEGAATCG